jgi:ABC-type transport system involved in multi-copper enzyme maturation permease subunit
MNDGPSQIHVLAAKEIRDAMHSGVIVAVAGFLFAASMVALGVSAIALRADVVAYEEAKALLISLGKPLDALVAPTYFPLRLMRGFIEQVEIIGAVLGIVLGYRAAAIERGRNTLALVMTRPISQSVFLAGKLSGNAVLISLSLTLAFVSGLLAIILVGGVSFAGEEYLKVFLSLLAAIFYTTSFFILGLFLALHVRRLPHALLYAFAIWLTFVLVAPQIGDTLDPDNQVSGGVFRKLHIAKPQEKEIMLSFASYETIRNGIEEASPAKHFERLTFALLGIKETYNGLPILTILNERTRDPVSLILIFIVMAALLFATPINFTRITRET